MKKKKAPQPSRRDTTVLRQLVELIPAYLVPKLARECGLTAQARTFSPWSHVVAMIYAQVSHACGLNDVCDALRLHVTALFGLRAATGDYSPIIANNFVHGGTTLSGATATTGFFMVNGVTGGRQRVVNNIFEAGSGDEQYGVREENHNADPNPFQNNNLTLDPAGGGTASAAYWNCNPTTCGIELTADETNTLLSTDGQATVGQGGNISDPACLDAAAAISGGAILRGTSAACGGVSCCTDAGLERNASASSSSCSMCETPFVDFNGVQRLTQEINPDAICDATLGDAMSGDSVPDIGPIED